MTTQAMKTERWLSLFIFIHILGWTLIPTIVRGNLPMDSIEGAMWGHQLALGYDKNPFLNGWLTALAMHLDHYHAWLIYLFSQLSAGLCFLFVFKLAQKILPPWHALASVMLLEGMQYYNFHAIDFNDNTLELSLWAMTIFFFYQALRHPSYRYWIATGITAALGMMAKYYTAALLASLALFLLCHADARKQLTARFPYVGLAIFLLIITPHAIWLCFHDFVTVKYVFMRTSNVYQFSHHFTSPLQFAWEQIQVTLPALLLLMTLFIGAGKRQSDTITVNHFDKQFLFFAGFGPFLLTLLLALFTAIKLRAGWGMPLLSLWGVIAMVWLKPNITINKLYQFTIAVFVFMIFCLAAYGISLLRSRDTSSANFPGKEVANAVTAYWHEKYSQPLTYVAGSRWVGGNVGFYSDDHPAVFVDWNEEISPWIQLKNLEKKGAVFLWEASKQERLPEWVKEKYPQLTSFRTLTFNWHHNHFGLAPVKIGVAILPPGS
jgi:4-amino-4-deoxy-L-arabinose transferase-like glycosyltransferase